MIINQNNLYLNETNWLQEVSNSVTNKNELFKLLELTESKNEKKQNKNLFSLRVPRTFINRMKKGNIYDPLLLQVLNTYQEYEYQKDYSLDPLKEHNNTIPCLLHKYKNRALILIKSNCAINCRYCFRRHFPYKKNLGNKENWKKAIQYIKKHSEINEVIFSGGDPLMAKDDELKWIILKLEKIPHLNRLRIHTRLPVVIPARITEKLCHLLLKTRLQVIMVTHINHAQEIDESLMKAMKNLKKSEVTLLNQSVLLRGINNNPEILIELSNSLFKIGILPYYLHTLDKVQGAAHFFVSDNEARILIHKLLKFVSGYLVPRVTREINDAPSKMFLDLKI